MNVTGLKQSFRFFSQSVNHLIWPAVCINCGGSIDEDDNGLCQGCWGELLECTGGDYCGRCGRDASKYAIVEGACPMCIGKEIYFDGIARAGIYTKALKKMILAFKLSGRTELDIPLGFLANSALAGSIFADQIEFFVPVPLHWSRRLSRGYNQSHVLAKGLKHPSARVNTDLVRIRRTRTQPAMVSEKRRAKNVAGAFAVRRGHKFTGRSVCLVDDIKTSGATLNECAKTLKEAGAVKVFALTLAVADQKLG